ncbi:MAG: hypothetical protein WC588_00945 [Candidatus Micrarchaeia archaeon]
MKLAIALVAALCLLFGCTGVTQEKYDSLLKSCEQEKGALLESAALEKSKAAEAGAALSRCNSDKSALQTVVASKDSELLSLQEGADAIAAARLKTDKIGQYELALSYYLEAYGEGKIPNTPKLNRIDSQVRSLSDSAFLAAWLSVRNCDGITDCQAAKQDFTGMISSRIDELSKEVVEIVRVK